jgi:hypothetical protein
MSRCKAPEILRSIRPWAAPAVKFLSEDGPNVLCTSATTKDEGNDADGRFSTAC